MNFEPNDLLFLKRALLNNSVVLFTGAGFSVEATNIAKQPIPAGNSFADLLLGEFLGIAGPRTDPLPRLYEAALKRAHDPLREFLRLNFECDTYASWYRIVTSFYWYRIYTANIDNVVEKVFKEVGKVKLDTVNGQKDDYRERDQFLDSLQYIKLNGKDWTSPKDITFGFQQYARRAVEAPVWYEQLARDFATRVILFVGTELDEQLFWNAVALRGNKLGHGERRPKSFWIKRKFSAVDLENLKEYNVIGIQGTANELFTLLDSVTEKEKVLAEVITAAQPGFQRLVELVVEPKNHMLQQSLRQFYSSFEAVTIPDRAQMKRKSFLMGAAPDWASLHNNLDAERACSHELLAIIDNAFKLNRLRVVSISGHAGSGKSTILMRLCLSLRGHGHAVFWSDATNSIPSHAFKRAIESFGNRCFIVIDNAAQIRGPLLEYLEACRAIKHKPVFILGGRTNRHVHLENQLNDEFEIDKYTLPLLSRPDIISLLAVLEVNGLLGRLQGVPKERQINEFTIRAGKQLLVAMREATNGRDFEAILADEYSTLPSPEIKTIYAAVCLATAAGYSVTTQQFVSLSDLSPNETLLLLDTSLKEVVVPANSAGNNLIARHRIIAGLVVDKLAERAVMKAAYIRLLAVLSEDLSYPVKQSSREFRIYREIVNHQTIWSRFPQLIDDARSIYESVRAHFKNDSHFWLQYGSLELEYGELGLADTYIASAENLAPHDDIVQNTKGFLLYKRSNASVHVMEAQSMRQAAREILLAQCARRPQDNYAPHILFSQELGYIRTWVTKIADRKKAMEELRDEVEVCLKTHKYNDRLTDLRKQIADAYIELALG